MGEVKRRIEEQIVGPADHLRRDAQLVAQITKIDEKNNVCSVEYIDKDGYRSNKDNVPVKIYSAGIIDWFPTVGEFVNIRDNGYRLLIESKYENAYTTNVRPRTELKGDILPTSFGSIIGGTIF
jgi:hypothetical protein